VVVPVEAVCELTLVPVVDEVDAWGVVELLALPVLAIVTALAGTRTLLVDDPEVV